ncbi:hypothetical protein JCM19232_2515 [Vibrio ishigakensis]|uniref:Uncharacterized protein n=1 Tax=Vibrio ishigakensis TaxID=1481914 RepID=A0A0B8P9Q0_9VIBR|nr:hypothetical protein JCM19232_2515 [Vibrio ishigakensis]
MFLDFKQNYEATIIGSRNRSGEVNINQKLSTQIESGETLFYIADER